MIRSFTLCARGYRFFVVHYTGGTKITASLIDKSIRKYQVITIRRLSRVVGSSHKKPTKRVVKQREPKEIDINSLFKPVTVSFPLEGTGTGREIAGPLAKGNVEQILTKFYRKAEIRILASEHGLEGTLFQKVFTNFKKYCLNVDNLPAELYIRLKDISQDAGHPDDLFPYFLDHAKNIFPHLTCMEELKKISDLTTPANWYPEARAIERKIIFHGGPTNSGKTFHAIRRMFEAESGIYCAPLKLLANEICQKSNAAGTPCDLITGEEKRYAIPDCPSNHLACTIEMASVTHRYKVAVIDEIQMLRDQQRGWAWTRALLGLNADEIHLCGEDTAINYVKSLMSETLDEFEVRRYKRLSPLHWSNKPLGSLHKIQPGDCIVCFSKKDIFTIREALEKIGKKSAVLYGSLPPGAKLSEAARFNDPDDPCKILIATDAIGMGLNLSIKRIIFYKLIKPTRNIHGELEMEELSTSQLLQIGGRAGRFGMDFNGGEVTTFFPQDIKTLQKLKNKNLDLVTQAGLHPTAEQIETFAYHLPGSTLSELIKIFEGICQLDGENFFMCMTDNFKTLADMIEHVPLSLRARYVFCTAPLDAKNSFLTSMFLKFARRVSHGDRVHATWFSIQIGWPFEPPNTIVNLEYLESVYDAMDLYLWLSYRFVDMFPDVHHIRDMQAEIDLHIQKGVRYITKISKEKKEPVNIMSKFNPQNVSTEEELDEDDDDTIVEEDVSEVDNSTTTEEEFDEVEGTTTEEEFDEIEGDTVTEEFDEVEGDTVTEEFDEVEGDTVTEEFDEVEDDTILEEFDKVEDDTVAVEEFDKVEDDTVAVEEFDKVEDDTVAVEEFDKVEDDTVAVEEFDKVEDVIDSDDSKLKKTVKYLEKDDENSDIIVTLKDSNKKFEILQQKYKLVDGIHKTVGSELDKSIVDKMNPIEKVQSFQNRQLSDDKKQKYIRKFSRSKKSQNKFDISVTHEENIQRKKYWKLKADSDEDKLPTINMIKEKISEKIPRSKYISFKSLMKLKLNINGKKPQMQNDDEERHVITTSHRGKIGPMQINNKRKDTSNPNRGMIHQVHNNDVEKKVISTPDRGNMHLMQNDNEEKESMSNHHINYKKSLRSLIESYSNSVSDELQNKGKGTVISTFCTEPDENKDLKEKNRIAHANTQDDSVELQTIFSDLEDHFSKKK